MSGFINRSLCLTVGLTLGLVGAAAAGQLFVGLEGSSPPTRSSDLAGFPDVDWTDHFAFDVSGAAATPDGDLYLCEGAFTTHLYRATLDTPPVQVATISVDISALAYGRGTLFGYSNYATPKGIYAIDTSTGDATLVVDVHTGTNFRFFGLGYNPVDDLLYGYTEYGNTGLYSIDIDSGEMVEIADPFPASNTQGRALAVGENTVYVMATRGDDGVPSFAYDLSQGPGGQWVGFTNPYPGYHSTGGATWISDPTTGSPDGAQAPSVPGQLHDAYPNPFNPTTTIAYSLSTEAQVGLRIFDLSGRLVRILRDGQSLTAGRHEATWDGRDDRGRAVPSGTYLYQLRVGGFSETKSMELVR